MCMKVTIEVVFIVQYKQLFTNLLYFISCLFQYAAVVNNLKRSLDGNNEDNNNDVVAGEEAPISDAVAQLLKKVKGIVRLYSNEEKSTVIKIYQTIRGELELVQRSATLPRDVCINC